MTVSGDKCYKCGSDNTKIVDVRYRKRIGMRVRTRVCFNCGSRFQTVEIHLGDFIRFVWKKE